MPIDDYKLDLLFEEYDEDDDGGIGYEEFVDALARGTVSNAAMGKRGMQSKEAMGVARHEMLGEQLGHGKKESFVPTVNKEEDAAFGYMKPKLGKETAAPTRAGSKPAAASAVSRWSQAQGEAVVDDFQRKRDKEEIVALAGGPQLALLEHVQGVPVRRPRPLGPPLALRDQEGLDLWSVPIGDYKLDLLLRSRRGRRWWHQLRGVLASLCSRHRLERGDGQAGMQSDQAMGVSAYEMLDEQLGHGKKEVRANDQRLSEC